MKQLRKKEGLTQKELAQRIEVSQSYVSKLEHGYTQGLNIDKILKISKILNVCPCSLFVILAKINCSENCFKLYKNKFF